MAAIVWARGVLGRLARSEPGGEYLATDRWAKVYLTEFVRRKARVGDLEISHADPDARKPETKTKEAE